MSRLIGGALLYAISNVRNGVKELTMLVAIGVTRLVDVGAT